MPVFDDGQQATEPPDSAVVETDVLIIGSGPAGGSAALLLSTLGVPNIMITKYRWTANTPRAHITNQRAMEIFRDVGIDDQVLADATEHGLVGDTVFCTSIAGEEIGRIRTWGTGADREADYQLASPCLTVDIPQTYLEPILVKNATMRGTQAQFSTEYLSHVQDADGMNVSSCNLAWKIAAVLNGQAGESLLDTYSAERAPVAERIVKRANRSSREFADLFHALRVNDAKAEEEMIGRDALWQASTAVLAR